MTARTPRRASSIAERRRMERSDRIGAPRMHRAERFPRATPGASAGVPTASVVVVAAGTVGVAVRQLLVGRLAHLDHFDVEDQGLAGERMVAADQHLLALARVHRVLDVLAGAFGMLGDEFEARLEPGAGVLREG